MSFDSSALFARLVDMLGDLESIGADPRLDSVHHARRSDAVNLLHYLTMRASDLREVQRALSRLGLSSLGRSERDVRARFSVVCDRLRDALANAARPSCAPEPPSIDAALTLGPSPASRRTRIMVTLAKEHLDVASEIERLLEAGMDVARINAAHDDERTWRALASAVRRAETTTARQCRIFVDIPGPKLRTLTPQRAPCACKVQPTRNALGDLIARATLGISASAPRLKNVLQVDSPAWVDGLRIGETIRLRDRHNERKWRVDSHDGDTVWLSGKHTAYFEAGARLDDEVTIVALHQRWAHLSLTQGDEFWLTKPEKCGPDGRPFIACAERALIDALKRDDPVHFDDGRMSAIVLAFQEGAALLRVVRAPESGLKLGGDKGINVPATNLPSQGLSDRDMAALRLGTELADGVSCSFVRSREDVHAIRRALAATGRPDLPFLLKIETREGFDRFPDILLEALAHEHVGVMIARGDLAVECGFERMAELQEELLWLCEAARVPVVWATQVLEQLTKSGQPTRAEITDAAAAGRAECVMLNKGPQVVRAVRTLDDILTRMEQHQDKKTAKLRALSVARDFAVHDKDAVQ